MEIKYIPINIINGYPDRTPRVTQWDSGQYLRITGLRLPAAFEVIFKNKESVAPLLVPGVTRNGISEVQIPNELLSEPFDITAYIVLRQSQTAKTVIEITLDMQKRLRAPQDATDPNNPYFVTGLQELIASTAETVQKVESASESTKEAAARAQAIADTLSPADAHYNPESWIAQSGVAVREAVWEALCNATEYTDEQLNNIVVIVDNEPRPETVGDFIGQICATRDGRKFYVYQGFDVATFSHKWMPLASYDDSIFKSDVMHSLDFSSDRVVSGRALYEFYQFLKPENIYYESQFGDAISNVKEALDFLDNARIEHSFEYSDVLAKITQFQNIIDNELVNKSEILQNFDGESQNPVSAIAVTEAISGAVGDIEAALDSILALQEGYLGEQV